MSWRAWFEKDAAVQQAVQRSADEIEQLKMTSSELRTALESQKFEFEAKLQEQKLETSDEHQHLRDTYQAQEELETKNG